MPPREFIFQQEIVRRHSHLSFQDPDKVAEALSLIWTMKHKWAVIGQAMGSTGEAVTTQMRLYVTRRNAIVHEADMHPLTNAKTPIDEQTVSDASDFVLRCGRSIAGLVT